ncbi:protein translocase subunit SecF [Pseudoalteromonas sp. SR44-5]|jgi:preprotein translocase subunit SecF|uniref:protein translocase subunit SecF n=1 Tax=Pseudoalteromonas TaxID=53246 RepID=UPI0012303D5B|nr:MULTISPECIES: protein translocase subunit SecF [Pseudoalteromonas]MBB1333254.1 protein translocase subunit SecF [Pseudoalteromonas sp. SR41-6]MBB1342670.1 protein translocase subunit SecF [Pseudoalteromonas sp. SR45-6]MBB1367345.1 protein translocase subunit SecF [Pseudoalteromonas sp. SR44-5]MBB1420634.1 protein translocase subunit SecF [Pseudoalteromonas sp. SG43-7]MBB1435774.1 protein translocase subunit SecF [Pseudoalteromonas sp. SG43-6]|tara:strand:- start:27826 stop:28752 length:927 start_codon:yes stop_codon:yes gene_type:complete
MSNSNEKMSTTTRLRLSGLVLSILLVLLSVIGVATKGLNFGLDFTGGYLTEFTTAVPISEAELAKKISYYHHDDFTLSAQSSQHFQLREAEQASTSPWLATLTQDETLGAEVLSSSYLGSQVGDELFEQGCLALFAAMVAVMIYLALRFEWRLALGSVVALMHDVVVVVGLFAWLQLDFNLTVLASLLAIIGYSLNDSIIVGDRVRELLRLDSTTQQASVNTVINESIKSTLTRTLITSGTTLATVASVWLLAGAPLQGFSIALFVGIVVGTLSSICIAATLPQLLGLRHENYQVKVDEQSQALMDMP